MKRPKDGKDIKFLAEYLSNGGNAAGAGREVGISGGAAVRKARELRGYIEEVMGGQEITPSYIINRIHERVLSTKNDMAAIAGLKLMGENLGLWERNIKIESREGVPLKEMVDELRVVIDMIEKEGVYVSKKGEVDKALEDGKKEILS